MSASRLLASQSPYLIQHAQNPVDWYPWSKEAFDKALSMDKPILLSIGYSTCHWCHVMAHESFEDEAIAAIINQHFIAIKVDREQRPDIDHAYMQAVSAMTGQGGWPLTVFLTPTQKPFYGGTYFPPVAKWGQPGFADLLITIAETWNNNRSQIMESATQITDQLTASMRRHSVGREHLLESAVLDKGYQALLNQFDKVHGGFGQSPKFPMGHTLVFLLMHAMIQHKPEALAMVQTTLRAMANGGICDHVAGGFHRYSTDERWFLPHYEKMLYDQAVLLLAYAEWFGVTKDDFYKQQVIKIADFVLRDMTNAGGAFFSAFDADSDVMLPDGTRAHREGAYYVWHCDEINAILTASDAKIFCEYFDVRSEGNIDVDPHGEFVRQNALAIVKQIPHEHRPVIERCLTLLDEQRRLRPKPSCDDKICFDWNSLMIAALSYAGMVCDQPKYIEAARRADEFLKTHLMSDDHIVHCWRNGVNGDNAFLDDYACAIWAQVTLYEATGVDTFLTEAKTFAQGMLTRFEDREAGGFFLKAQGASDFIFNPKDHYDGALPSGQAMAAFALAKLGNISNDPFLLNKAKQTLNTFAGGIVEYPSAHCFALLACACVEKQGNEIHIIGPWNDVKIAQMRKVVYNHLSVLTTLKWEEDPHKIEAKVCRRNACLPPVNDHERLDHILQKEHYV